MQKVKLLQQLLMLKIKTNIFLIIRNIVKVKAAKLMKESSEILNTNSAM